MGMAWSWKQLSCPRFTARWLGSGWLALLKRDHTSATDEASQHADGQPAPALGTTTFESFFLRYDRQITSYLWRMTGDEQIASELAQETFLRAWLHFETISQYEHPLAWLFHVATNLARQHHRRQMAPAGMPIMLDATHDPAGSDPSIRFVEQDLVRQILLQMPFQQRSALILREIYGLSCAEIGSLLHISRAAVKMVLWRAREQFRVRYLREDGDV